MAPKLLKPHSCVWFLGGGGGLEAALLPSSIFTSFCPVSSSNNPANISPWGFFFGLLFFCCCCLCFIPLVAQQNAVARVEKNCKAGLLSHVAKGRGFEPRLHMVIYYPVM